MMNTVITLTANGNVAPARPIDLGFKYENVGDTITFDIPEEYKSYHHYLAFYMKKLKPILLPINNFVFEITTTITRHPGTYDIVFLATEKYIVGENIDGAHKVYVSNTMQGIVKDNPLADPVVEEGLDKNLQVLYDDLLNLKNDLDYKNETKYYLGDYYLPSINAVGVISWQLMPGEGTNIRPLPDPVSVRGPQGLTGNYIEPVVNTPGVISWLNKTYNEESKPASIDLNPLIQASTDEYLANNLKPLVDAGIDAKLKWEWDAENKMLYITAEEGHDKEVTP